MRSISNIIAGLITMAAISFTATAQTEYHDAANFLMYGRAYEVSAGETYGRLPDSLKTVSRESVWNLGRNTSGMAVRFRSDSPTVGVKWINLLDYGMNHMTDTGVRGLDLYILESDGWRFANAARPGPGGENTATIIANMESVMREYMLYFPLYDGLTSLQIGIDPQYSIDLPAAASPRRERPVVFYGTSILQGACASRPGMAFTNILGRWLDRETFNFGFSGNAFLDYEIAEVMASIDAGCYVLDFVPNTSPEMILEKAERFYNIIREKNPGAPVIFVEDPCFPHSRYDRAMAEEIRDKNRALEDVFARLVEQGEREIYYLPSDGMTGTDGEATVDGIHFTDAGMIRYSEHLFPLLRSLLPE